MTASAPQQQASSKSDSKYRREVARLEARVAELEMDAEDNKGAGEQLAALQAANAKCACAVSVWGREPTCALAGLRRRRRSSWLA